MIMMMMMMIGRMTVITMKMIVEAAGFSERLMYLSYYTVSHPWRHWTYMTDQTRWQT